MNFVIQEARICRGSPTSGSENACTFLAENGAFRMFSVTDVFRAEGSAKANEPCPGNMKYLGEVMAVSSALYENTLLSFKNGAFPITIGGDHSCAIGTIGAAGDFFGESGLAVVYIDGHADINTENSTLTGFIHGMPLASSLGLCDKRLTVGKNTKKINGENVYIIGARSIDDNEYPIIRENGVHLYTAGDVRRRGMTDIMNEVCGSIKNKAVHVSFDVDFLDKDVFPATGYLMPDGLDCGDAREAIARIMSTGKVVSFDCVEYNPSLDKDKTCMKKLTSLLELIKQ